MKRIVRLILAMLILLWFPASHWAVESGMCRLLSISDSENLILVSLIPGKEKILLDIASTKITVDGKPAELGELKSFSIIRVKWNRKKDERNGVRLDGSATEIEINSPKKPAQ